MSVQIETREYGKEYCFEQIEYLFNQQHKQEEKDPFFELGNKKITGRTEGIEIRGHPINCWLPRKEAKGFTILERVGEIEDWSNLPNKTKKKGPQYCLNVYLGNKDTDHFEAAIELVEWLNRNSIDHHIRPSIETATVWLRNRAERNNSLANKLEKLK